MDPLTLAALAQGTLGIGQMLGGLFSKVPDRPNYSIPDAVNQQVNIANRDVNSSMMPGEARMQGQIEKNTANTVSRMQQSSKSSSDLLQAASGAQMQQNQGLSNLYMQGLSYRDRARSRQMQALSSLAGAQDKAWEINKQQPFLDAAAKRSGLIGGGLQTTADALSGLSAIKQQGAGGGATEVIRPQGQASVSQTGINPTWGVPMGNGSLYSNIG